MASKKEKDTKQAASQQRIAELVDQAIGGLETRLTEKKDSLTIQDLLKVMQLQKEIEDEQATEVTVTWVEPEPKKGK
jgi:hypothetical protein